MAETVNPADWGASPQQVVDPSQWGARPISMDQLHALWEGIKSGATAGFSDELTGLASASGLPKWMQGDARKPSLSPLTSAIVGGARLAYEKFRGATGENQGGLPGQVTGDERGPVERTYDESRDAARARQKTASEEYPKTFIGGELTGALAVPVAAEARAATLPVRVARAAITGGAYGGASGFGEGEGLADSAARAIVGTGVGAVTGGVAAPVIEGATRLASRATRPLVNAVRGYVRPDDEAARRVTTAIQRDMAADPQAETRITPQEFSASRSQPGGGPAAIMDIGGEPTRALARSAANTSPEGRRALNSTINQRFEDQSQRVVGWLQETFNYPDAAGLQKAIDDVQKTVLGPRYKAVYRAGDKPLWNPQLERLTSSPDVADAMREAATKGKSRAVTEGYGGFNPGVTVDQSGNVTFAKGQNGVPTYPNLQFWDYTKRALDDAANAAGRAGRKGEAETLGNLARQLRGELDNLVPSYKGARATAASFFGAENALEAGQNFVTSKLKNREAAETLAKMSKVERQLFQDGFVSRFIDHISEIGDRRNVLNQIAASPAARARLAIALGPQRASQLEAGLRVEGIMDLARGAVQGNSTTARQLAELGLAGGPNDLNVRGVPRTLTQIGIEALSGALNYGRRRIDQGVSRRVAEMLASNDPAVLLRGIRIVSGNGRMFNNMRLADQRIAAISGEQAGNVPALQAGSAGRADQDQQNVPRPPGQ
jgi:hypothetical protein